MTENGTPRKDSHPSLAKRLKEENETIIRIWESEVRATLSLARNLPRLALRDSLPAFLDCLADALVATNKSVTIESAGEIGKKHGEERAKQTNYNISEVLIEYWILRAVIFRVLEREEPIPTSARDLVLHSVDEGIRHAVEEFAQERTRNLEQSNRDLEHFAAVAAHDLKAPLSTISGYLEVIEEQIHEAVEDEVKGFIKTTKRAAAQMSVMIDRLLEYSSVGRDSAPFDSVAMNEVVESALLSLKSTISKSGATVKVGDLPVVNGDVSLLGMVFQNLISNAVKFKTEDPPRIEIECEEKEEKWIFSVSDNGIGFDPRQAENIFAIFKQFHQPQKYQGFGIGLATAKKVVELHGGEIWARSSPGQGAIFFFSIPK